MSGLALETVATGLLLPEGPVAMKDGSLLFVEVGAGRLNRIDPAGRLACVADLGGGPNGAAIGPDGALYVCNNGGGFDCRLEEGRLRIALAPDRHVGGSIQRVDLATGDATTLYVACGDRPLLAPNDIVFGADGDFFFTDHGLTEPHRRTFGGLYHARADGGGIRRLADGLLSPNGIGLSPDGRWLYWADTLTVRLWRREAAAGPGDSAELVATAPGDLMLDSLAVEADGRVCIGTIRQGGIAIVSPGGAVEHVSLDDAMVTNLCFGGADGRDLWVTAAGTGRILRGRWPRAGLPPAFTA